MTPLELSRPIATPPANPPSAGGVPLRWVAVRFTSLALLVALSITLIVNPADGLVIFWRVLVPLLPLLFLTSLGVWRNICPVSAANQLPRVLGFSRALEPPRWIHERGYLVGIALLAAIIPTRRVIFDHQGPATAALLVGVVLAAFVGGALFKGKSGWCSSICPMLPIERLYGRTPFALVRNNHCAPCVGCAKHCYDADPVPAYRNDMRDSDRWWRLPRRGFAGAFPGVIVAYFTAPAGPALPIYLTFGAAAVLSLLVFAALGRVLPRLHVALPAIYASVAIGVFYFFGVPVLLGGVSDLVGRDITGLTWPIRLGLLGIIALWLGRTVRRDRRSTAVSESVVSPVAVQVRTGNRVAVPEGVRFEDCDLTTGVDAGASILEAAEGCGVGLTGACRAGMCGADPVAVLAGADHLSPIADAEAKTLRQLGLPGHVRLACSARFNGTGGVVVSTDPAQTPFDGVGDDTPSVGIDSVVIIGNGVAGVTAAEEVRRLHAECEIHLIGREVFPFYNRMAIARMVHDRTAMTGLTMKPDSWYDELQITNWINTQVRRINRGKRTLDLATGEILPWDRLILATGSRSSVPPIPGADLDGVFVLREATDALAVRSYVQEHHVRRAAIVGGGLLGLEAGHAIHQLGLTTTVLEGAPRLLPRFLDDRGSDVVMAHFAREGVDVRCGVAVERILGHGTVSGVDLGEEGHLDAELVVICAGITPNTDLAAAAGLAVGRGIVVDAAMRTSASGIYAAGDATEFDGGVVGLWSTASAQAEVAARSAIGIAATFDPTPPAAILKGVGLELTSIGRVERQPGELALRWDSGDSGTYAYVVLEPDGRLAGAILVDRPGPARLAVHAMQGDRDPKPLLEALDESLADLILDEHPGAWPPPPASEACQHNHPGAGLSAAPRHAGAGCVRPRGGVRPARRPGRRRSRGE